MTTEVLTRRRFTVEEYYRMAEAGVFRADDRVELIEGEIVEMSPIGKVHAALVRRAGRLFQERLGVRVLVSVQNPIHLGPRSEPQPDLVLLRPRADDYVRAHPGPADIFLVVEVADTSQDYDRNVKIPLYARAGVVETWLLDAAEKAVTAYGGPAASGYGKVTQFGTGRSVSPSAFPDVEISVDDLFRQIP